MTRTPAAFYILKEILMHVKASHNEFFPTKYNGTWTKDSFSNASEPVKEKLTLGFDVETPSFGSLGMFGSISGQTQGS